MPIEEVWKQPLEKISGNWVFEEIVPPVFMDAGNPVVKSRVIRSSGERMQIIVSMVGDRISFAADQSSEYADLPNSGFPYAFTQTLNTNNARRIYIAEDAGTWTALTGTHEVIQAPIVHAWRYIATRTAGSANVQVFVARLG